MKASTAKPLGNPPTRDKTFGIDPDIRYYELEDGDKTEEGEYAEILIILDKRLESNNKNLFKRKFPYIHMFDHQVTAVVRVM